MQLKTKLLLLSECLILGAILPVWLLPTPVNLVVWAIMLGLGILTYIYYKNEGDNENMKNKLWKRKTSCDVCKGEVVYNQTHHWVYCPCTAPVKMELSQDVLNDQWTSMKEAKA